MNDVSNTSIQTLETPYYLALANERKRMECER